MPRMGVLASKSSKRDRVVLMTREYITKAHYPEYITQASPFGLPLRVDIPSVDPAEWEDDDDDD